MSETLFRKEALAAHGERLSGELILSQPLTTTVLGSVLGLVTLAVLVFLATNSYARKVSVEGQLVPDQGVIEVPAPAVGQIETIFVKAGALAAAGAPLFEVRLDHTLGAEDALTEQLLLSLQQQQSNLQRQLELQDETVSDIAAGKAEQEALLQGTQERLLAMLDVERELVAVRDKAVARALQLQQRGLLSQADLETVQGQALQQQQACQELELQLLQNRTRLQDLVSERNTALLQSFQHAERLAAELAELHQRKLRLTAEQTALVRAPLDARVSAVHLQRGMMVTPQQSVLALLPAASRLQAELLVPSAAIGFIGNQQAVRLRFDAFPYQKFGVQPALVQQVSHSTEQLRQGEHAPVAIYRAQAALEKQSISAYGQEVPLRAGMQFSADVLLDERSLLEWLLEPLFSIRGALCC